jgi:hypothetical protein
VSDADTVVDFSSPSLTIVSIGSAKNYLPV